MKKLVLVTVYFKGATNTKMVSATIRKDGSASISEDILWMMAQELGCQRGQTYSWG